MAVTNSRENVDARDFYCRPFKENNAEIDCVHVGVCVTDTAVIKREGESREKGRHSTLISSTYGWASHISLIRFIRISLSPKIGRVWKNGCLEGPLISPPSALLT